MVVEGCPLSCTLNRSAKLPESQLLWSGVSDSGKSHALGETPSNSAYADANRYRAKSEGIWDLVSLFGRTPRRESRSQPARVSAHLAPTLAGLDAERGQGLDGFSGCCAHSLTRARNSVLSGTGQNATALQTAAAASFIVCFHTAGESFRLIPLRSFGIPSSTSSTFDFLLHGVINWPKFAESIPESKS